MTGVAADCSLVLLVAIDTPLHLHWLLESDNLLRLHIAVTRDTIGLCCGVRSRG